MKYMGSKNRIAKYLLPIILKDRKDEQWYIEPFVGGCNIIDKVTGNRIGNDINEYLISFLQSLQCGFTPPEYINNEMYLDIKNNKDKYSKDIVGCVGFCFTYAAKWFGGFIGNSNDVVCVGRDRLGESYRSIEIARKQVDGIVLLCVSYLDLYIPTGSIIYCDPPYAGTTSYKDNFDHIIFWQWVREKVKEGHQVFISEYNAPEDFICIWSKEIVSSLTKNTGAKIGIEKLFCHKSQYKEVI